MLSLFGLSHCSAEWMLHTSVSLKKLKSELYQGFLIWAGIVRIITSFLEQWTNLEDGNRPNCRGTTA